MMVYINYPKPHFTLHSEDTCPEVQKHHKPGQRVLVVTPDNLGKSLSRFIDSEIAFASNPKNNDMWLNVSLGSCRHEESLIYVIQMLLGQRHSPFMTAPIETHACPTIAGSSSRD